VSPNSDKRLTNTIIVVLMGAETPIERLEEQMQGVKWDGTGVGYGVRGARLQDLTIRLEGELAIRPYTELRL
jgi:hypothetical protein